MEGLLLDFAGRREKYEAVAQCVRRLEANKEVNKRELRRLALFVVQSVPVSCGDEDGERTLWISKLRDAIGKAGGIPQTGMTVRKFFSKPQNDSWCKVLKEPAHSGLKTSTIHEAKGREYQAACVVIPPDHAPGNRTSHLFDAWEQRQNDESKRVIYVGVTKAQHLLALAVPAMFLERTERLLCDGDVKSEILRTEAAGGSAKQPRPRHRTASASG